MNVKDFKDLTGEDPEDMFGGDWQNTIEDMKPRHAKDCDSVVYPMGKCTCEDLSPQEKITSYRKQQGEI